MTRSAIGDCRKLIEKIDALIVAIGPDHPESRRLNTARTFANFAIICIESGNPLPGMSWLNMAQEQRSGCVARIVSQHLDVDIALQERQAAQRREAGRARGRSIQITDRMRKRVIDLWEMLAREGVVARNRISEIQSRIEARGMLEETPSRPTIAKILDERGLRTTKR